MKHQLSISLSCTIVAQACGSGIADRRQRYGAHSSSKRAISLKVFADPSGATHVETQNRARGQTVCRQSHHYNCLAHQQWHDTCTKLQAANAAGQGPWSKCIDHTTRPSIPSECRNMRVTKRACTAIVFTWEAAASHGSDIICYQVEMAAMPNGFWQALMSTEGLEAEAKGLLPGQHYNFRVRAENAVRPELSLAQVMLVSMQLRASICPLPRLRVDTIDRRTSNLRAAWRRAVATKGASRRSVAWAAGAAGACTGREGHPHICCSALAPVRGCHAWVRGASVPFIPVRAVVCRRSRRELVGSVSGSRDGVCSGWVAAGVQLQCAGEGVLCGRRKLLVQGPVGAMLADLCFVHPAVEAALLAQGLIGLASCVISRKSITQRAGPHNCSTACRSDRPHRQGAR